MQVTASTPADLSSAFDALAEMIVKLTEENIVERQISVSPMKECFAELESELKKKDVLLLASSCRQGYLSTKTKTNGVQLMTAKYITKSSLCDIDKV